LIPRFEMSANIPLESGCLHRDSLRYRCSLINSK